MAHAELVAGRVRTGRHDHRITGCRDRRRFYRREHSHNPGRPVPAIDFDLAARDIHRAFAVFRRQRSTRTLV